MFVAFLLTLLAVAMVVLYWGMGGAGALGFLSSRRAKAVTPGSCGTYCLQFACLEYECCLREGGKYPTCFQEVLCPTYLDCIEECEGIKGTG